jgi:ubiquinone/menaquinone biosynthesis C-methylase UbiE
MSVASHLGMSPAVYDRRIRGLIPHYDAVLVETAAALHATTRPVRAIVELGIGTGALTAACLELVPRARVTGIDIDDSMSAMARRRLGRKAAHVRLIHGNFTAVDLPRCDAIVASFALHHIRSERAKAAFYRRCARALRPGGVLISGDCFPPDSPRLWQADVSRWVAHLANTFGSRVRGAREFRSWQSEDYYLPLSRETTLFRRAGFVVDVPWRRSPLAVVVAIKPSRRPRRPQAAAGRPTRQS